MRTDSDSTDLNEEEIPYHIDIEAVRAQARALPGPGPVGINTISVACSIRPRKFIVEGGDDTATEMPRTAYQLVYGDGNIMLDAGLDLETHESFGKGEAEPYYPDQYARLQQALEGSKAIFLSHYHGDHAGGILQSPNFKELAHKTIICAETARLFVQEAHRPHLQISEDDVHNFIIVDYPKHYPIAPGVVAIKSPGHSSDSQMAYVRMANGREFLHSFDVAWNMDNIKLIKNKAAPWVPEDKPQILGQLRWLNGLMKSHPEIKHLVAHDDHLLGEFKKTGEVGLVLDI
jgi:glyoxylase-like metal-dependent hydrolase (beta-lactamase superfamily II)